MKFSAETLRNQILGERVMAKPVKDGESPVAFYRVANGYCGLYEGGQQE